MATFFTADTHFGHGGALGLFRRPFVSVAEMNEVMIARWNEAVGADDEVWHLGDFAVLKSAADVAEFLRRLNGRIHLIIGNNDSAAIVSLTGFQSVQHYTELKLEGVRLVLCHYPFRSWNGMNRGAINLHGHSHGRLMPMTRQIDVGVDIWDFRPVPVADALAVRGRRGRVDRGVVCRDGSA